MWNNFFNSKISYVFTSLPSLTNQIFVLFIRACFSFRHDCFLRKNLSPGTKRRLDGLLGGRRPGMFELMQFYFQFGPRSSIFAIFWRRHVLSNICFTRTSPCVFRHLRRSNFSRGSKLKSVCLQNKTMTWRTKRRFDKFGLKTNK